MVALGFSTHTVKEDGDEESQSTRDQMALKQKLSDVIVSLSPTKAKGSPTAAGKGAEKSSEGEKETSKL